jgi:hypothetical protein
VQPRQLVALRSLQDDDRAAAPAVEAQRLDLPFESELRSYSGGSTAAGGNSKNSAGGALGPSELSRLGLTSRAAPGAGAVRVCQRRVAPPLSCPSPPPRRRSGACPAHRRPGRARRRGPWPLHH